MWCNPPFELPETDVNRAWRRHLLSNAVDLCPASHHQIPDARWHVLKMQQLSYVWLKRMIPLHPSRDQTEANFLQGRVMCLGHICWPFSAMATACSVIHSNSNVPSKRTLNIQKTYGKTNVSSTAEFGLQRRCLGGIKLSGTQKFWSVKCVVDAPLRSEFPQKPFWAYLTRFKWSPELKGSFVLCQVDRIYSSTLSER